MPEANIIVLDETDIPGGVQRILSGARRGVKLATESGVEWIKEDVMEGQEFVGDEFYPDVKPTTKQQKAEKGREKVGILTGNLKASFDTEYDHDGLEGIITGGGPGYEEFLLRWQIDMLFLRERGNKSRELIRGEINKEV